MSTAYNRTSSYNRTYEKRVIEEAPHIRVSSPIHATTINSPLHVSTSSSQSPYMVRTNMNSATGAGLIMTHQQSDDYFYVKLDLSLFKPEDLKVSVIGQFIVVEARHGEQEDEFGLIERHIIRKFHLPRDVPGEAVTSKLTADGHLSVTAAAPRTKEDGVERTIPIKIVPTEMKTEVTTEPKPQSSNT